MRRAIVSLLAVTVFLSACAEPAQPPLFSDPAPLSMPSGPRAEGPRLSSGPGVPLLLSWMSREQQGGELYYSLLDGDKWGIAHGVIDDGLMFVNWADVPQVIPVSQERWLAHWLSKSGDATYAYDVKLAESADAGATWQPLPSPHDDGTQTEHGFVSSVVGDSGVRLVWLDGRNTADGHGMTLRTGVVQSDGSTADGTEIDNLVCDCCRTDIAANDKGTFVVYRNRTEDEIRDIYLARQVNGKWLPGEPVADDGWEIAGCPVNGPAIDAHGDIVAIAWFTVANNHPRVQLRISKDGGKSFGDALRIATNNLLGQVDVEVIDDTAVAVSWVHKDPRDELADVMLRSVTIDGAMSKPEVVGRTAASRSIPVMHKVSDFLYFAWTDTDGEHTRLASSRVMIITEDDVE